ncbi:hypothetical protein [Burkholderia cepacia]|uniref:hypothetical protein n=1 Tax=Burkholderia cepacia TaxID=292 RepID=UPI0009BFD260|nr:hypothetical protein [Burkholderia cepacia]
MSQLVQIAPGVVFSTDVLGAEWVRKHQPDSGHSRFGEAPDTENRPSQTAPQNNPASRSSKSAQMSLL